MSLEMLIGADNAAAALQRWPDRPYTVRLPDDSPIARIITPRAVRGFLDAGCGPAGYVHIYHQGAGLHPARFTVDDRVSPASVQLLLDQGCTIQLREMDRWWPPLAAICTAIQTETCCPTYATSFITPPGTQGLDYHWDQNLGIIVQLDGTKTWELWKPRVDSPHRDHAMSTQTWDGEWVKQWREQGPEMEFELQPGDVLVLPRGWVHNPHSRRSTQTSVHMTFVLKERSPVWVAERLVASAVNDSRFRAVIPPADFAPERLPAVIDSVRSLISDYLATLDVDQLAKALRYAGETESSHNIM
ncbi:cupin domain-containing protein [Micromonospora maritima]|uniref:cupin domain-containing protein n=1 Tax=Micromonospora maritima TaxID=986711 RepID=UPI001FE8C7DB|nr:cupin domain-containing protein [Micromonospora maritima]